MAIPPEPLPLYPHGKRANLPFRASPGRRPRLVSAQSNTQTAPARVAIRQQCANSSGPEARKSAGFAPAQGIFVAVVESADAETVEAFLIDLERAADQKLRRQLLHGIF